ncbi:uncharacterized protein [Haliotis asinina]|uniref:uncharacterized protein n=1 Tax=Haliotis asinina TaxID=109174 RepID=UPI0035327AC5
MDTECIRIWDVRGASLRSFVCNSFSRLQGVISENTGIPPLHQLLLVQNMKLGNNNWRPYSSAIWYLFSMNDPSQSEIPDIRSTSSSTTDPDDHSTYVDMKNILTNARSTQKHLVEGTGALRCFVDDESKILNTKIQDTKRIFIECQKSVDGLLSVFGFALTLKLLSPDGYMGLLELRKVKNKYFYFLEQCEKLAVELTEYKGLSREDSKFKKAVNLSEKHRVEAEMNMARFERLMLLSEGKTDMETQKAGEILVHSLEKLNNDLGEIYSGSSDTNSREIQKLNVIWKMRKNVADAFAEHQSQLAVTVSKWQAYLQRLTALKTCK